MYLCSEQQSIAMQNRHTHRVIECVSAFIEAHEVAQSALSVYFDGIPNFKQEDFDGVITESQKSCKDARDLLHEMDLNDLLGTFFFWNEIYI